MTVRAIRVTAPWSGTQALRRGAHHKLGVHRGPQRRYPAPDPSPPEAPHRIQRTGSPEATAERHVCGVRDALGPSRLILRVRRKRKLFSAFRVLYQKAGRMDYDTALGSMKYILLALSVFWSRTLCYSEAPPDQSKIIHEIDAVRTRFHIPGIAFGVANCDAIVLSGSLGVRETGTTNSVSIHDRFHIGSLGKGLLAFMAGKLVDEGKISWNTKFFDLFPEMKPTARSEYYEIDLKDLLSHRARLNRFNDWQAQELIDNYNALHKQERFSGPKFASYALTLEPEKYGPGELYKYSTLGYLLASLMLEKTSGLSYAQLLARTDKDLGLNFQIGWPKSEGKFRPCGHLIPKEQGWGEGTALEVWNGDKFVGWGEDYLYYATPAGHLNVTVLDFLKYLQLCLNGLNGRDNYLKASTYDFVFNGAKEYSMGWGNDIVKGNHHYSHNGSVGTFFANAIIIKERRIAMVIMANAGNGETKGGLLQVIKILEAAYANQ